MKTFMIIVLEGPPLDYLPAEHNVVATGLDEKTAGVIEDILYKTLNCSVVAKHTQHLLSILVLEE